MDIKPKNFRDFLQESLNRPYKWKWGYEHTDALLANFQDKDGMKFKVWFYETYTNSNDWEITFGPMEAGAVSFKNTGKRDSLTVLSTVMEIFFAFLSKKEPDKVIFTGEVEDGKAKLYKKMLKHFGSKARKLGYKSSLPGGDAHEVTFHLTKIESR